MSQEKTLRRLALAMVLLLLAFGLSYAQRLTGRLMGTVTDENGLSLPGVSVEISSPSLLGGVHSQVTGANGEYRFLNLPPGIYKAVFKLEGFQTIERADIIVSLNITTVENITLKLAALEESITVTAASPVIDVTKSGISTTYSKVQLEKLPFNRNTYFDIVNQTAGFTTSHGENSSRFMAYGSNSEENAMYVEGVDLSNPEIGTAWSWPVPDMFEEVEITGIGAGAEYGNFAGAVVNIVTKSGGNTFSGSASYYGQYKNLTGDNNPKPYNPATGEGYYSFNRVKWYDYSFTLGGPILKDRIWLFAVYNNMLDRASDFGDDPNYPYKSTHNEQFIKVSAQLSKAHKLVLMYNRQKDYGSGAPDPYNMPETVMGETDLVHIWTAMWTWVISKDSFFELKYSGYYSPNDYQPAFGGSIYTPARYDGATGITSNGPVWPWFYKVTRNQANANLTHFADDFLAGDHEFKIGVQFNRGTCDTYGGYGGGKFYYDYGGEPYLLYEWDTNRYGGTVVNISGFIDDSWKVSNRLTVNFGLRFDHHNAFIPAFPLMHNFKETGEKGVGIDDLIIWNSFSPRIGLAFQLTSDQKTLFKASYGRYHVYPYIANWEWPGPNAPDKSIYYWDGKKWVLWYVLPTEAGYTMDPNIKNPYYDQFSVGLERELANNLALLATFIYKKGKDVFGYEDRGGKYELVTRVSPDNGQTYEVWNWVGGEFDYWLTNPKGWGQTYKGLILELNKRYANNWMMNASVTWSKAEGLNLSSLAAGGYGMSQSLVWYTGQFGTDPNQLINAKGPLNLDKRWLAKLSLGYNLPFDILISANYLFQSGRPTLKFVRIRNLNQPYSVRIQAEPKGKERFDSQHLLNLRIEKTFNLYKTARLTIAGDIFNVLNDDTITRWRSYNVWSASYKEPMWIPYPRRFQLGLKLQF
ncbi:MAG: TonB-dependent receptor [Clostridiales bacterium]|nr:TonB-dependent receptor [Clostridiales bacterium]